jgi:hypothetical protein
MGTFKSAELPSELAAKIPPVVRAEDDALYLAIRVYDVKNPDDLMDFQICFDKKFALQLAADLIEQARKLP